MGERSRRCLVRNLSAHAAIDGIDEIRTALVEVNALTDLLRLAKEQKQSGAPTPGSFVIESVGAAGKRATTDADLRVLITAKRNTIQTSIAALAASRAAMEKALAREKEFNVLQASLIGRWKVGKSGRALVVDFGYRSCGSRGSATETIAEIKKNVDSGSGDEKPVFEPVVPAQFRGVTHLDITFHASMAEAIAYKPRQITTLPPRGCVAALYNARSSAFAQEVFSIIMSEGVHTTTSSRSTHSIVLAMPKSAYTPRAIAVHLAQGPLVAAGGGCYDFALLNSCFQWNHRLWM